MVCGKLRWAPDHLRTDYAYLFERFFYYLEDLGPTAYGIVVFDELDKVQSHLLVGRMDRYIFQTHRQGAALVRPNPAGTAIRS
jgi:hypothetical protein